MEDGRLRAPSLTAEVHVLRHPDQATWWPGFRLNLIPGVSVRVFLAELTLEPVDGGQQRALPNVGN